MSHSVIDADCRAIVTHPTGNANVRNLLVGLAGEGILAEYHTTIAVFASGLGATVSRLPYMSAFTRRTYPEVLRPFTEAHPWRECARMMAMKSGWNYAIRNEAGWASIDAVIRSLDAAVAKRLQHAKVNTVYAYEDGAYETFRAARALGVGCVYEHPVGYWREVHHLMCEEAELEPEWAATMRGLDDSDEKLARKDAELALADRVVVASSFSRNSLALFPGKLPQVTVIPYGAPLARTKIDTKVHSSSGKLRVLFVGGLGQMKGLSYLFKAVGMLGNSCSLTLVGRGPIRDAPVLRRALRSCRWIETLPHNEVLREMGAHDVLVFPSLSEGFGMVVTEALSQGLPVITTPHTCGPDVLTDGEDGFIVPIRDPQAIAEKLELLHRDRERLAAMSEAALRKAQILTWESYRRGVVSVVREALALKAA